MAQLKQATAGSSSPRLLAVIVVFQHLTWAESPRAERKNR